MSMPPPGSAESGVGAALEQDAPASSVTTAEVATTSEFGAGAWGSL